MTPKVRKPNFPLAIQLAKQIYAFVIINGEVWLEFLVRQSLKNLNHKKFNKKNQICKFIQFFSTKKIKKQKGLMR